MDPHRRLTVLQAEQYVADEINQLIDDRPGQLIHVAQLRKSSQSIAGNVAEGFDRRTIGERHHSLGVARGEAGETIIHLRPNFVTGRIDARTFWRLYNRLMVIRKMLSSHMNRGD